MSNRTDPQGYSTKVTRLADGYGIRLLKDGVVVAQSHADTRLDVGPAIKDMLRWHNKLGGSSTMADASRERNYCRGNSGKRILP